MRRHTSYLVMMIWLFVFGFAGASLAQDTHDTLSGVLHKIDDTGKKIALETKDGAKHTLDVTEHTALRVGDEVTKGSKAGARAVELATKKSTHAVVHVVEDGGKKIAHSIKVIGDDVADVARGTVVKLDHAAHTVLVELETGAQKTFHLAKDGVIAVEHGLERVGATTIHAVEVAADKIGAAGKTGADWVIHFTEESGEAVAHAWQELTTSS